MATRLVRLHTYVVNGIVASGLGDNEALNLAFPRQKSWKARRAHAEETAVKAGAEPTNGTSLDGMGIGGLACPSPAAAA